MKLLSSDTSEQRKSSTSASSVSSLKASLQIHAKAVLWIAVEDGCLEPLHSPALPVSTSREVPLARREVLQLQSRANDADSVLEAVSSKEPDRPQHFLHEQKLVHPRHFFALSATFSTPPTFSFLSSANPANIPPHTSFRCTNTSDVSSLSSPACLSFYPPSSTHQIPPIPPIPLISSPLLCSTISSDAAPSEVYLTTNSATTDDQHRARTLYTTPSPEPLSPCRSSLAQTPSSQLFNTRNAELLLSLRTSSLPPSTFIGTLCPSV